MASASQLDSLTLYLWDPISQGVQHCRLSVDRSALDGFTDRIRSLIPKGLKDEIEEQVRAEDPAYRRDPRRSRISIRLRPRVHYFLRALSDSATGLSNMRAIFSSELQQYLAPLADWMAFINDLPTLPPDDKSKPSEFSRLLRLRHVLSGAHGLFDSDLPILASQDAVHITTLTHPDVYVFEVTSVQKDSLDRFQSFLSSVPEIKAGLRIVCSGSQYSSRAVLEPYMAGVSAWIRGRTAAEHVPRYLLEYLEAATRYYDQSEWRTAIVLSAIALETLLAEMYEHEFRQLAPDKPLGALKDEIVKLFKERNKPPPFPNDILEWMNKTNDARVAAVHRGSRQLSGRETLEALRGSLRVILWYNGLFSHTGEA